jgi:hypothetical protein
MACAYNIYKTKRKVMKQCNKCLKHYPIDGFYLRKDNQPMNPCKECRKAAGSNPPDKYWSLYYLPEEHYIGITKRLKQRMRQHATRSNKITDGYEVLCTFERAIDARWVEAMFHMRGYAGYNH